MTPRHGRASSGRSFVGGLFGATEELASEALETFPADIPSKAGQRVGVNLPAGFVSDVGVSRPVGFAVSSWVVVKQAPKPGSVIPAGSAIKVRLAECEA